MKIQETKQMGILTTTRTALLMATFAIAFSVTPALQSPARADNPLDKSSPNIAPACNVHLKQQTKCKGCTVCWFGTGHGMYRDRGKSSPKIAHGRAPDRDDSWTDWLFRMLGN